MRAYGDAGLLVELADLDTVLSMSAAISANPPAGVIDVVPAARTVLVRLDPVRTDVGAVARALRAVEPTPFNARVGPLVEIPVTYDGADLDEVGRLTGLGPAGVVDAHTAHPWTVAFCGFAPGFGYCTGGDPRLRVARRDEARTRVPAGSVALADAFTGVYPRESPGGWQLIGCTEAAIWDANRDPPASLRPGVRVQFVRLDPAGGAVPE